jgi:hypothetical protein
MASLGLFMYGIISSVNRNNLISSFPIYIPYVSFSCLTTLAKNSSTVLSKNGKHRHPANIS